MDPARLLDVLKQENELLRERVARLESILMQTAPPPIEWRLTASEARVFGCLVNREIATKDAIMAALYCDRLDADGAAEPKIVDVFVCKMRRKLKPFGVEIRTVFGQGFVIDPATRSTYRSTSERSAA